MMSTCHMNCCIVQATVVNSAAYLVRTACRAGHSYHVAFVPNSMLVTVLTQALVTRGACAAAHNNR